MYTELVIFRNELKNKHVHKYKLTGIFSQLIFSKEIFKKNSDIDNFIQDVLDLSFKAYVMKSRTMIVSKISKLIFDSNDINKYIKPLSIFINIKIDELKPPENLAKKDTLDGWIN